MLTVLQGDALAMLKTLPDSSVQMCVTSPPYWGLRDYQCAGQLGLEKSPAEYVAKMVEVFREVRRVMKPDASLWLNIGDSYAAGKQGNDSFGDASSGLNNGGAGTKTGDKHRTPTQQRKPPEGMKAKDLVGVPWMLAFALRNDGWWLRSDIIWHKPNPMPESVTDRPTKSHEYLFLLSKSATYFYDAAAIAEPATCERLRGSGPMVQPGTGRNDTDQNGDYRTVRREDATTKTLYDKKSTAGRLALLRQQARENGAEYGDGTRNKRTVWTVATSPYPDAHFATYPPDLIKPCILAGSRPGDAVLDPFGGSGTTGMVALELGRKAVLIELNPAYVELIESRCNVTPGLPLA